MFCLSESDTFYLYPYPTDMRKSFYSLSGIVTNEMKYVGNISVQKEDIQYVMNAVTNTGRDRGQVRVPKGNKLQHISGH